MNVAGQRVPHCPRRNSLCHKRSRGRRQHGDWQVQRISQLSYTILYVRGLQTTARGNPVDEMCIRDRYIGVVGEIIKNTYTHKRIKQTQLSVSYTHLDVYKRQVSVLYCGHTSHDRYRL